MSVSLRHCFIEIMHRIGPAQPCGSNLTVLGNGWLRSQTILQLDQRWHGQRSDFRHASETRDNRRAAVPKMNGYVGVEQQGQLNQPIPVRRVNRLPLARIPIRHVGPDGKQVICQRLIGR